MKHSNRYAVLFGTMIIQFVLGSIYAWSIFNNPLASAHNWSESQVAMTFSITGLSLAIGALFAGQIKDALGIKITTALSGVCYSIGSNYSLFNKQFGGIIH